MSLDLRYLHKGLENKGFKIEKSGKDLYCRFYINGATVSKVRSKVGGHSAQKYKTLGDKLVYRIYSTLHFDNKKQFLDFLECPYTLEEYQRMLSEKGHINLKPET